MINCDHCCWASQRKWRLNLVVGSLVTFDECCFSVVMRSRSLLRDRWDGTWKGQSNRGLFFIEDWGNGIVIFLWTWFTKRGKNKWSRMAPGTACVKERELQNSAKVWIAPVLRLLTFITHFLLSCEASVAGPVLVGKMLCLNLSGVLSCIQHLTPHPPPPRMSWFADGTFVRRKRAPYSKQGTKTRAGF